MQNTQQNMLLFSFGVNHKSAPLEVREKLFISEQEKPELIGLFKELLLECIILSTCNRTEIYGVTSEKEPDFSKYIKTLTDFKKCGDIGEDNFFKFISKSAVEHLFSVTSGIDSLVLGDSQIIHQVKEGYALSMKLNASGKVLNQLFQKALHTGK